MASYLQGCSSCRAQRESYFWISFGEQLSLEQSVVPFNESKDTDADACFVFVWESKAEQQPGVKAFFSTRCSLTWFLAFPKDSIPNAGVHFLSPMAKISVLERLSLVVRSGKIPPGTLVRGLAVTFSPDSRRDSTLSEELLSCYRFNPPKCVLSRPPRPSLWPKVSMKDFSSTVQFFPPH